MMDDFLNELAGGSQSGRDQADADPLADLLGGLLGGGATPDAGGAGDLLQGLLGGSSPQGTGGMDDILNAFMGGGAADMGTSSILAPIANALAEKLGLPPQVTQMIVTFVVGKLLSGTMSGGTPPARGAGLASQGGLDLNDLLERMSSGQGLDSDYMHSTGMAAELSQQTGLDSDTAARSLQEALQMLGGQLGSGQPPQR